jgi:hypothetical protein
MPRYRILNRVTKKVVEVEAPFAQDACESVGWQIGDCYIELLREGPYTGIQKPRELRTGGRPCDHSGRNSGTRML